MPALGVGVRRRSRDVGSPQWWHPSVTIGAYINVAAALGLHLVVPILDAPAAEPATITVGDYPGLRTLAWQTDAGVTITETEALNLYERGWRHLNQETLTDHEKTFFQHLADTYSNGSHLSPRSTATSRRIHPGTQNRRAPSGCLAEHPRLVRKVRED